MRALFAKEPWETVASAVVAVAVARAVGGACQQGAIVALEAGETSTHIVDTSPVIVTLLRACPVRTVNTAEAVVTETRAVEALSVVRAVAWAHLERAIIARPSRLTSALEMFQALPMLGAVVRTCPNGAVRPGVSSVAVARAVEALAVALAKVQTTPQ